MEFEETTASTGIVDEATRIAAGNRQLTMNPVHEDIVPEDEPDDLIAARHILNAPIGNIDSDSEATVAPAITEHEKANHRVALASSIVVMAIVGVAAALSFLSR